MVWRTLLLLDCSLLDGLPQLHQEVHVLKTRLPLQPLDHVARLGSAVVARAIRQSPGASEHLLLRLVALG